MLPTAPEEISYGHVSLLNNLGRDLSLGLEALEDLTISMEANWDKFDTGGYLKGVFEKHCPNVKFDSRLAKAIKRYAMAFVTKNEEHIQFFGSILLGVYKVRFLDDDRLAWFDDILDCDEIALDAELHSLPTINESFVVSSDSMNHSFIWLLHGFHHTKLCSVQEIHSVKVAIVSIMHYKFISSLMAWYFKYPADKEIALATYSSLSKKFDLKQYGSWGALITARAESIVANTGLHFNTYVRYDTDKDVVYMLNDIQSRIRELVKALTHEFMRIKEQNERISSSSSTVELEGEKVIRDRVKAFTVYRRYLQGVIGDRNSFIKPQLVTIVSDAMSGAPEAAITDALVFVHEHYNDHAHAYVADLVDEVLLHAFDYIQRKGILINDLQLIVSKLRAIYTASRSSDPSVLKMRSLSDQLVEHSVKSRNDTVKAGVRTSVLLYILLRALTKNYYTTKA